MSSKDRSIRLSEVIMIIKPAAANIITGAAFGSALALSEVYSPSVIVSQMQLRNFHMLETFLTASAISVLIVQSATKTGYCLPQTRAPSSFRSLPYSGNILGGLLIGTSMSLTGACPGTAIVQAILGSLSGLKVVLGGLLGGITLVKLAPFIYHTTMVAAENGNSPVRGAETASDKALRRSEQYTIAAKLGVKTGKIILAYEALCIGMIVLAAKFAPNYPAFVNPVVGGLAIGAAQALSMLISRKTIGVTGAHEQLANDFWSIMSRSTHVKRPYGSAIWFTLGIIVGAKALASQVPILARNAEMPNFGTLTSLVSGATMVVGAALADGCPSGHGISGMATLSLSSFVTVAAMFGGGIVCKALIG